MEKLPLTKQETDRILSPFGLTYQHISGFADTSRSKADVRWNVMLDQAYVLKINSLKGMWEARLQEISRLIARYQSIGLYCPGFIPTLEGPLSYTWTRDGQAYTCFVEEYARYPIYDWEYPVDRKAVVEHLGLLAARYTNVDLSETHAMWSIIDLSPFDGDVDEKQENADTLVSALRENGYPDLADQVTALNLSLRRTIRADYADLPRCVFQGDLNNANELHDEGRFVGLIDFNCSGTDVNINVFLNETNWFPSAEELDVLPIPAILAKMDAEQADAMSVILRHYAMNDLEKRLCPYYKRIVDLFQYPGVCEMVDWLADENRSSKCAALIKALVDQPLTPAG